MKKIFTLFGVFLVSLTLALTAADANAAKFGGKRSFGKSYRTAPAQQVTVHPQGLDRQNGTIVS